MLMMCPRPIPAVAAGTFMTRSIAPAFLLLFASATAEATATCTCLPVKLSETHPLSRSVDYPLS